MAAIKQVLTIAGSDSGGGAGIQADIKTFQELGVFGTSAITAVTAQNTCGVHGVYPMSAGAVKAQIDAVGADFAIAAVKTGMLFDAEIIAETAAGIERHGWHNLVVDPVMIAKGGATLLQEEALEAMRTLLLPLAAVITPNIPEAEMLSGMEIHDAADRKGAAEQILAFGAKAVVIKGGHADNPLIAEDYCLDQNGESFVLRSARIHTQQTHGTGCTFSAVLTAELAKGQTLPEAMVTAKRFIQAALSHQLHIGAGHGPTNHAAFRQFATEGDVQFVQ
ncbi:bifunctional hydroxymethylpyrimidine kinase/phosphomethylpyrimidine kinase [Planococcus halotolerans]|uniref:bifunctional hydroxymethylpyrimidine kinase/phosphomethylpyrimidine kinase n=1 Tax=Planococcus halotolerans TaxID=2233542 RepID=UPI001092175D|nr:bifunctional hydroxymethylpyrimidine kinase/phosphomethylpyrimidine kinase [Planococcus halotolerans]QHJ69806.1 bifunctional hydroxymethylpyrimidine kinase/phosphomethylpyrimidine kinase [Planococcus halotolerans]